MELGWDWLPHLGHFLVQAGRRLFGAMGTTALAVAVGLTATFGPTLYAFAQKVRKFGYRNAFREWRHSFKFGAPITLSLWIALSGWAIMATVYQDHVALVKIKHELLREIDNKKKEVDALNSKLSVAEKERESERARKVGIAFPDAAAKSILPTDRNRQGWHEGLRDYVDLQCRHSTACRHRTRI